MGVDYSIISIGTLAVNRLWGESRPARTSHATTTLVCDGKRRILVDPSLPAAALAARFFERTGQPPDSVTDVFCTSLRPVHRRSVEAFPAARWWCAEAELESYSRHLAALRDSADRLESADVALVEADLTLLERFKPAPDKFSEQVSLFPLPGPSDGSAGLLLTPPTATIVIAGDAALTRDHVEHGQVWEGATDTAAAMDSLTELLDLADVIIPGHDNVMFVTQRMM